MSFEGFSREWLCYSIISLHYAAVAVSRTQGGYVCTAFNVFCEFSSILNRQMLLF